VQACDTRLGRDVAIALVKTDGLDEAGRLRVRREAQAMAQLGDHPHVVTAYDIADHEGQIFIVSQLMRGGSLEDLISAGGQLAVDDVLRIGDQICQALEHAHTRGVIHRDLKPGNIWLNDEGDAALGDFGLAVSLDRSRVTQEGMMVGTVAYMAPEQALGQTPDPRSDLYALGVTLYEALVGRPPFVGDDVVAIVSQHINTPPVAASWHNPQISRALDGLLLGLLAKNPDDRPASASEVRRRLSDVSAARRGEGASVVEPSNPLDALAGGVFVGREREVTQLRTGVDDALSGKGRVLLLVGEPGIGKTRTSEELGTYASLRGAAVLWGRCYEGEGAPTYWPWIQLVRSYINDHDAATLLSEFGSGASAVAEVVSEVRECLPGLQPAPSLEAEQARFRLFDSIASFLRRVSQRQPIVLMIDDLHWADKPSLLLLQFVARELEGSRILVLGTYRDVELGRTHPLAETLAELARAGSVERVVLRGLEEADVMRFIELSTGQSAPVTLGAAVHRETEGNPFFVHEVVRLLASEGRLEGATDESSWSLSIPQGIREVVGRRLSTLSETCNQLLTTASVIGREFDLPVLSRVSELDAEATMEQLEEAVGARLVEEMPDSIDRYRFAHALVRETLYAELGTTRRVRQHRRVEEVLEEHYAGDLERHLAELAHHAVEGAHGGGDVEKAIDYATRAGDRARALFAFEDAAPHYDRALQALDLLERPDPLRRCDLLIALGTAQRRAIDRERGARTLREAVDLARAEGEYKRMALAASELSWAVHILGRPTPECVSLLNEVLAHLGGEDCREHVDVLRALTYEQGLGPTAPAAQAAADEAVAMSRRLGDSQLLSLSLVSALTSRWGLDSLDAREANAREIRELAQKTGDTGLEAFALSFQRIAALERGDRDTIERLYEEEGPLVERAQDASTALWYHVCSATFAILDADWDRAEALAGQAFAFGQRVEPEISAQMFGAQMSGVLRARGKLDVVASALEERVKLHPQPAWRCALAPSYAELGRHEEARAILEEMCADEMAGVPNDGNFPVSIALLSQACATIGAEEFAPILYAQFAPHPKRVVNIGTMASIYGSTSDWLGRMSALMGHHDEAVSHFEDSLEILGRLRARYWIADTQRFLAEVLMARDASGDKARAIDLLNAAIDAARQSGMDYLLKRAIAAKLDIQGVDSATLEGTIHTVHARVQDVRPNLAEHAAPDGTVTIMFSDIVGFTAMTERLGDLRAREVVRGHNGIVREILAAHAGYEVELQGDGFLLAFGSARQALLCAIAIQKRFADRNATADEPLQVRIGLHTGEALRDADKFFGRTVILAARIAGAANGGEILVSSLLKQLTESTGDVHFGAARQLELKGISGVQEAFGVQFE